jgi:hypothetical protein
MLDNLTDAPTMLVAVRDASMLSASGMMPQEISILRKDHSRFRQSEAKVCFIRCAFQACLKRRRHIDASIA